MASFPFPKEAATIVRGDYANALFHVDLNLNKIIKSPGDEPPRHHQPVHGHPARRSVCKGSRRRDQGADLQSTARRRQGRALSCPAVGLSQEASLRDRPGGRSAVRKRRLRLGRAAAGGLGGLLGGRWLPMTRGVKVRLMAFVRAQRRRHRLRGGQLPRPHRPGARPRHLPSTPPCPRRAGCSPAARSPTEASRSARSRRWTSPATGLRVDVALKDGTKIPLDSKMYVHNLSAVGEQYLDFEPPDNKPPYAEAGRHHQGQMPPACR